MYNFRERARSRINKCQFKKLVPDTGDGKRLPVPVLTVKVVAVALIPAASTVCALLAANSVSAINPPGFW